MLQFDPLGVECIDCHQEDYISATQPNHVLGGYSTNCTDCHLMNSTSWTDANFVHTFFPLTGGHDNVNCEQCHTSGDYTNISNECVSCHQDDYNSTSNPNHISIDFPLSCDDCHSTNPGWKPAQFKAHDSMFPIYSGKHNQEWDNCTDCHSNLGDYSSFSCTDCHAHNQQEMNNEHDGIGGYLFDSEFCYSCHPTGSADAGFDHNTTLFALTGAHTTTDCKSCHTNGYPGTSTVCSDCHTSNYNQSANPNHAAAGNENTCETCHTTDPGWKPASFQIHDNYYPLTGGHTTVANDCSGCHNGDYNSTPNSCDGCHISNYNQTSNPDHTSTGIAVTCNDCHSTEPGWTPAVFPIHDNIYSFIGAHSSIANDCAACHNGNYNNTSNSCDRCYISNYNQSSNPNHSNTGISVTCNDCHTTDPGWTPASFPTHGNYYPLTGSHATIADNCTACHNGDYTNTVNTCEACHISNYSQTSNPNHNAIGISTSCSDCHTPDPGWKPASFNIHNNYYSLEGAHLVIANNCTDCHNGEYNNTPNTCEGCHLSDYNQTNNPQHASAQFPTDCETCHGQNLWVPSTFNHDGQYFPIYSGMHNGQWTACFECHTNSGNYSVFTCIN
ncbi:MAG TPA: hypothetical protein VI583_14130 [Cyclobacteriaceae bacterium]|nr:hypothetical protein [Cyclobacteriaceae bacterium]